MITYVRYLLKNVYISLFKECVLLLIRNFQQWLRDKVYTGNTVLPV